MSYGVGHKHDSDPILLVALGRPAAIAPIRPLAWNLHMPQLWAKKKKKTKKKKKKKEREKEIFFTANQRGASLSAYSML